MAAMAGLSLTLDPMGKMFQNAFSLKPLGQLKPNCPGIVIGRSSTKFMLFLCRSKIQDGHHRMTYNLSFRYHVGMTAKVEVLQINNIVNRKLNQRLSRACIVHLVIKRTNWSYVKTMSCSGSHLGITINIKNTKFVKDLPITDAQFRFNQCNSFREEYISVFSHTVLC